MTTYFLRTGSVAPRSSIAYHLASLACALAGPANPQRDRLAHIAHLLHGIAPNVPAALAEARCGLAHPCDEHQVNSPETWLLTARACLLEDGDKLSQPPAPPGSEATQQAMPSRQLINRAAGARLGTVHGAGAQ